MAYGGPNDDVIDDVTWPSKVKVVIPISLRPVISKTARDRDSVLTGHHKSCKKIHLADICTLWAPSSIFMHSLIEWVHSLVRFTARFGIGLLVSCCRSIIDRNAVFLYSHFDWNRDVFWCDEVNSWLISVLIVELRTLNFLKPRWLEKQLLFVTVNLRFYLMMDTALLQFIQSRRLALLQSESQRESEHSNFKISARKPSQNAVLWLCCHYNQWVSRLRFNGLMARQFWPRPHICYLASLVASRTVPGLSKYRAPL